MHRSAFYTVLTGLTLLNAFLLSRPNLLGKIGLIVYKYYYLRTYPRTLLTVAIVCVLSAALMEMVSYLVRRRLLGRITGIVVLMLLLSLSFAQLIKTGVDFSAWTYSHTGLRFRLGAFMLPTVVILIFAQGLLCLPRSGDIVVGTAEESGDQSA